MPATDPEAQDSTAAATVKAFLQWQAQHLADRQAASAIAGPLYHYTNAAGLLGMLDHQQIWFTRHQHLNDPSEFQFGLELLGKVLDEKAELTPRDSFSRLFCEMVKDLCRPENFHGTMGFYIASFSLASDDLEQWRLYADNGRGFSLGLDASLFSTTNGASPPNERYALQPVGYGVSASPRLAAPVDKALALIQSIETSLVDSTAPLGVLRGLADPMISGLIAELLAIKHPAYAHEREVRLVLYEVIGTSEPTVDIRARGSELVPFVRVSVPNLRQGITSVHIGPAAAPLSGDALDMLLHKHRVAARATKSVLPYRPAP